MGVAWRILRHLKKLWIINNTMLFKTVMPVRSCKELKNRAVLIYKNIVCVAMWLLVMYSNCLLKSGIFRKNKQFHSAMLLLKVHLCDWFSTVLNTYIFIHVTISDLNFERACVKIMASYVMYGYSKKACHV